MTTTRSWFKKAATSGAWVCYILASSGEEADALHTQQISHDPALAQCYSGPARVVAATSAEVAAWLKARSATGGVVALAGGETTEDVVDLLHGGSGEEAGTQGELSV